MDDVFREIIHQPKKLFLVKVKLITIPIISFGGSTIFMQVTRVKDNQLLYDSSNDQPPVKMYPKDAYIEWSPKWPPTNSNKDEEEKDEKAKSKKKKKKKKKDKLQNQDLEYIEGDIRIDFLQKNIMTKDKKLFFIIFHTTFLYN